MNAILVQGLGFGDEGKGTIVDALVRRTGASLVVRFNGGSQAGHHVVGEGVDQNGYRRVEHCCSQVGAGVLANVPTYLSRYMFVDPITLMNELRALPIPAKVIVDIGCPVTTPWHKALNRLKELARGNQRHGSCGMGIGELASDIARGLPVLSFGDVANADPPIALAGDIRTMKRIEAWDLWGRLTPSRQAVDIMQLMETSAMDWLRRAREIAYHVTWTDGFHTIVPDGGTIIFEGAQGVLLDERHGFHPHTTWSNCTFDNAMRLCYEAGIRDVTKVGVLRAFATRHGNGPFPTEFSRVHADEPWLLHVGFLKGEHNAMGPWQGGFRYGYFDAVLARYALACVGGVDVLALTCVDRLPPGPFHYANRYADPFTEPDMLDASVLTGSTRALNAQEAQGRNLVYATPVMAFDSSAIAGVESALMRKVDIVSRGPMEQDKAYLTGQLG